MRFVFPFTLTLALTSSAALCSAASKPAAQKASPRAPENPEVASATDAIDRELLEPLGDKEAGQAEYSRAYVPPHDRTARILDSKPRADADGHGFLTFTVDESRSGGKVVRKDTIGGCVYPDSGKVFVGRGGVFYPAGLLLGKKVDAVAGACKAADESAAPGAAPRGWLASIRAKL